MLTNLSTQNHYQNYSAIFAANKESKFRDSKASKNNLIRVVYHHVVLVTHTLAKKSYSAARQSYSITVLSL